MSSKPDTELLAQCMDGDDKAWEILVRRYFRLVYNLAYRYSGNIHEAEDMTQEVFVKIYRSLKKFQRSKGEFKNWIMVMARNQMIDHIRKQKREPVDMAGTEQLSSGNTSGVHSTPYDALEREEKISFVHNCLGELTPDLRITLTMREIDGMSYDEISSFLKVPLGTIKSRINRARIELARIMNIKKLALIDTGAEFSLEGSENELH